MLEAALILEPLTPTTAFDVAVTPYTTADDTGFSVTPVMPATMPMMPVMPTVAPAAMTSVPGPMINFGDLRRNCIQFIKDAARL